MYLYLQNSGRIHLSSRTMHNAVDKLLFEVLWAFICLFLMMLCDGELMYTFPPSHDAYLLVCNVSLKQTYESSEGCELWIDIQDDVVFVCFGPQVGGKEEYTHTCTQKEYRAATVETLKLNLTLCKMMSTIIFFQC